MFRHRMTVMLSVLVLLSMVFSACTVAARRSRSPRRTKPLPAAKLPARPATTGGAPPPKPPAAKV